jgi:ATP-dependent RNA helicase DDX54/DBP10
MSSDYIEFDRTAEDEKFEADNDPQNVATGGKKKKSGGFQSFGLSLPVYKGIMKQGYKVPTPVQRKAIPILLNGHDLVAMARTGSGDIHDHNND